MNVKTNKYSTEVTYDTRDLGIMVIAPEEYHDILVHHSAPRILKRQEFNEKKRLSPKLTDHGRFFFDNENLPKKSQCPWAIAGEHMELRCPQISRAFKLNVIITMVTLTYESLWEYGHGKVAPFCWNIYFDETEPIETKIGTKRVMRRPPARVFWCEHKETFKIKPCDCCYEHIMYVDGNIRNLKK